MGGRCGTPDQGRKPGRLMSAASIGATQTRAAPKNGSAHHGSQTAPASASMQQTATVTAMIARSAVSIT